MGKQSRLWIIWKVPSLAKRQWDVLPAVTGARCALRDPRACRRGLPGGETEEEGGCSGQMTQGGWCLGAPWGGRDAGGGVPLEAEVLASCQCGPGQMCGGGGRRVDPGSPPGAAGAAVPWPGRCPVGGRPGPSCGPCRWQARGREPLGLAEAVPGKGRGPASKARQC